MTHSSLLSSILLFCLSLFSISSFGQFEEDYIPQKCSGDIPSEFNSSIVDDLVGQRRRAMFGSKTIEERELREKFLIKSNSFLKELFESGKVLFGDPTTEYVKKVLEKVLEKDKRLRSELKVFTLKSSSVNAMCTHQGYIFVTTGLIAQLDTEAQLAYILSHEVIHYEKRHSLHQFVEQYEKLEGKRYYDLNSYEKALGELSNYSKQHEYEADKLGMEKFLKTAYRPEALLSMFDILEYSHLPFAEAEFDYKLFESSTYELPRTWKIDVLNPITPIIEREEYSTHPDIDKRREVLYEGLTVDDLNPTNGNPFLVSKEDFFLTRNICRFETIKSNLLNLDYARAIYHAWILQSDFPQNKFLDVSIAKGFYGLSKQRKYLNKTSNDEYESSSNSKTESGVNSKDNEILSNYKNVQGNEQRLHYAVKQMSEIELNLFALKFILDTEHKHKDPSTLKVYKEDLLHDLLTIEPSLSINHYTQTYVPPIKNDSSEQSIPLKMEPDSVDFSKMSKRLMILYNRKKRNSDTSVSINSIKIERYILGEHKNNQHLTQTFEDLKKSLQEEKEQYSNLNRSEIKRIIRWEKKYGDNLGIKAILTLNPIYENLKGVYNYSNPTSLPKTPLISEEKKINYTELIRNNAQRLGMENTTFNPQEFYTNDIHRFNDMTILNEWIREKLTCYKYGIIPLSSTACKNISEKYNTSYLYYSGVISHSNGTNQFHYLFNLENGENLFYKYDSFTKQHDYETFLNSQIYHVLAKINRSPKKPMPIFN